MEYEKGYHEELHNSLINNSELYRIRAKIAYNDYFKKIDRDKKILEYGCGLGQNIFILSQFGMNVYGYDISKFAVDFCNKQGINATTEWNKIPKVDIIFSKFVLEHVTNPYDELKKMHDKLNDNGLIILVLAREKYTRVPLTPDENRHLWTWNFQAINNLLYETGFNVINNKMRYDRGGFTKLFKPLYQVIDSELLYTLGTKLVGVFTDSKEIRIYARKR
jgi:SAM-dependent methyltransferase